MSKNNKILYFVICVFFTSLLDLHLSDFIIKNICVFNLKPLNKFIEITYYENTGAAFSIFQHNTEFLICFAIISILILFFLLIKNIHKVSLLTCFFSAILTSGIICNTYERITFGFVRDFFQINFINFPVFNISDILINAGVLAIMFIIICYKQKMK